MSMMMMMMEVSLWLVMFVLNKFIVHHVSIKIECRRRTTSHNSFIEYWKILSLKSFCCFSHFLVQNHPLKWQKIFASLISGGWFFTFQWNIFHHLFTIFVLLFLHHRLLTLSLPNRSRSLLIIIDGCRCC